MAKIDSQTRIRNAKRLSKILKTIPQDVQDQITKTMERGAIRTAKKSSDDVVKRTGELSKSIEARNIDNDQHRWGIYANFYWLWVEFGTKFSSSKPFFMSHWRKLKKTLKNSIKRNVKKKLKQKYGKR